MADVFRLYKFSDLPPRQDLCASCFPGDVTTLAGEAHAARRGLAAFCGFTAELADRQRG